MPYVAPGRTTTVHVGYYQDMYTFKEVSGARFTSSDRRVLTVSKTGTVTGVAPGNATVVVTISGQTIRVSIGVRTRIIWESAVRRPNSSPPGLESIVYGIGFKPNSRVQLTTNGLPGVYVTESAVTNDQGYFGGTTAWDGWYLSGPRLSITYWGGPTPEEDSCPSSATWIVTATDELGASSSMSGTCPPKPPGWPY